MSVHETSAVSVRALSVTLRREQRRVRSLREYVVATVKRTLPAAEERTILDGVTFDVARGELLAIVGPNGAGKTTLLRVLAGIIPPARGVVCVEGGIAPLIELGAGFDPELTGIENVYLYGSVLGMRREAVRRIVGSIVDFAGIAEAADVPVKSYSSGMIARLGFAAATAARPDVLLVDEVLAVGDEEFRGRCAERILELRAGGTAIVVVTHDLAFVERSVDRALLLDGGRVRAYGYGAAVIAQYRGRPAA